MDEHEPLLSPRSEVEESTWLRTVLDAAMDAVVIIDGSGQVLAWNPAAASMFQYTAEEAIGRDIATLAIPGELQERHHRALAASAAGRPGALLGRRVEVVGQRRDGSRFPVELTITRTDRDSETLFTGYLRDITARRALTDDLRQSKTRLVEVSDRTRRDIERNLHDGAQQQLVGLAMLVTQARAGLHADPDTSDALLATVADVLVATINEIRELARGLLPAALSERGLAPALAELGRRSAIPVDIVIDPARTAAAEHGGAEPDFGRWPPTVETTVYFLVAEALANAAKHGARWASVRLGVLSVDALHVDFGLTGGHADTVDIVCRIDDDGPGGADPSGGSGLVGLRDRVTAVGGTFSVHSPPGGGTTLTARIRTGRVE